LPLLDPKPKFVCVGCKPHTLRGNALAVRADGINTTVRCGRHWYVMVPQAAADDPAIAVGPGYITSPLGNFEWVLRL
jgi:hypothetical protein